MEKIVVVVEDLEVARTALHWALHNILRSGDVLTLLHVYPTSTNNNKHRRRRLRGFHLALSFRSDIICQAFPNVLVIVIQSFIFNTLANLRKDSVQTKTEILVTDGDRDGRRIAAIAGEIGASTVVVGLHDRSFLYRLITPENDSTRNFPNCKVLAVKTPTGNCNSSTMNFSQIEISMLNNPPEEGQVHAQKIPYRICPDPAAIIWRSRPRTRSSFREQAT